MLSWREGLSGAVLLWVLVADAGNALAQGDPAGHAAHHPAGGAPADASPSAPVAPSAPMDAGMGGMMEGMMGAPASQPPQPSPDPPIQSSGEMPSAALPSDSGSGAAKGNAEDSPPVPESTPLGDHAAHHGGGGAPTAAMQPAPVPATTPAGGTMGGTMGMPAMPTPSPGAATKAGSGCGGMMGCMGSGTKPFYPALMDMPSLTPEARRFIEAEAAKRLGAGSEAITIGQMPLHHALSTGDPAAMQQVVAGVREGVLLVESGASALQAINEGQPPRQLALAWFKGQMGVPIRDGMAMDDGPWGLSWFHLTTMAFLVAFMLGVVLIHYARVHRISVLVQRLTPGPAPVLAPAAGPTSVPTAATPAVAVPGPAVAALPAPGKAAARPWSGALRVADIFRETPNVKTFRLVNADGGVIPFTFLPGQFLTFSAQIGGKPIRRSYTIASSPTQREYVEVTVKREEQGAESRYLHDNVAVGDHLGMSGPSGAFTFTGTETDSIVLISGGVGITPMMCVTRYLTDRGFSGEIFFLHGARVTQDFIFREELEYLQKRHGNLHVAATMSVAEGAPWAGEVGPISKEFIARAVPEIARRRVHLCGPPAMMDAVRAQLADLGVPGDKIKAEAFGPATGAVPAPEAPPAATPTADASQEPGPAPGAVPQAGPLGDAASPALPAPATAAAAPSAQAEVQFSKSGKNGPLAPDKCVLEAAEAIGVAIDFSCRVGTCGICAVPLLKGAVTMEVEDGLPPTDKARGIILACQAKSASNLVVAA